MVNGLYGRDLYSSKYGIGLEVHDLIRIDAVLRSFIFHSTQYRIVLHFQLPVRGYNQSDASKYGIEFQFGWGVKIGL